YHIRSRRHDDRLLRAARRVSASSGGAAPVADQRRLVLAAHGRGRQQLLRRDQGAPLAARSACGTARDAGGRGGVPRLARGTERLAFALSPDALPGSAAVERARVIRVEAVVGGFVEREARVVEHGPRVLGLRLPLRRGLLDAPGLSHDRRLRSGRRCASRARARGREIQEIGFAFPAQPTFQVLKHWRSISVMPNTRNAYVRVLET